MFDAMAKGEANTPSYRTGFIFLTSSSASRKSNLHISLEHLRQVR